MTGRRKLAVGIAGLAGAAAIAVPLSLSQGGGTIDVFVGSTPTPTATATATSTPTPTPTPTATPTTCDRNATTSTFAAQISAATAGQTVCLTQSASYGTFGGTNKAITITPAEGVSPTITLALGSGDCCFTIDGARDTFGDSTGLTINNDGGPSINSGVTGVTVRDTLFTDLFRIDGPSTNDHDGTLLLDHDEFAGATNVTAALHASYTVSTHTGVTVQNSLFRDTNDADGIQMGSGIDVLNNEFRDIEPQAPDQHTDMLQTVGARNAIIRGNWFHGCEQAIGMFNGGGNILVEHNVIDDCTGHWITFHDHTGTTVRFNTLAGGGSRAVDCNPGSTSTTIVNNLLGSLDNGGGCTGTFSNNITSTPTFVGGANPTSFAGYALAPGSAGKNAASDGTDAGVFGEGFGGGPPSE